MLRTVDTAEKPRDERRRAEEPAPDPHALLALQRSAGNQAVARMVQTRAQHATLQRAIDGGNDEYADNRQRVRMGTKLGTIVGIQNKKTYKVTFDGSTKIEKIDAAKLDLSDEAAPSADAGATPNAVPGQQPPQAPEPYTPTRATVIQGESIWTLKLEDADGNDVGTRTLSVKQLKALLGAKVFEGAGTSPKAGSWAITGPLPVGPWLDTHLTKKGDLIKQFESAERFRAFEARAQGLMGNVANTPNQNQATIFARLEALGEARAEQRKGEGHGSVKMTKIPLLVKPQLSVGGANRLITHLYTQAGNETELRCYLGNDKGAYQRVHTSLTMDDERTSHTMVQTGEDIAVPGWMSAPGATRIGFNAKEGAALGYGNRKLTERDKATSTVKTPAGVGDIQGQAHSELSQPELDGSTLLAVRFNRALDDVFKDIFTGTPQEREVKGITADFTILDKEWQSPAHKGTPEAEFHSSGM
ncbi:hypothetical protein OJ997_18130 [Solirubrobacter phytolaccae]|uniref:Uncharacterized protein n=1 Tax=Solirubrobacter phytolaccae TaxID=1404360 RepID=A0A9X3N921_9ACTN|nr:hypothetical protein [Solirubrobacter phytolaccae]MDA0182230.1 hypothetical protein [Solirubrobacter phytolaccae]